MARRPLGSPPHIYDAGTVTHNRHPAQRHCSHLGFETWTCHDSMQARSLGYRSQHTQPASLWGSQAREISSNTREVVLRSPGAMGPGLGLERHSLARPLEMDTETQFHPRSPEFVRLLLVQMWALCLLRVQTYRCQTPCLEYTNTWCCPDTLTKSSSHNHSPAHLPNLSELQTLPLSSAVSRDRGLLNTSPASQATHSSFTSRVQKWFPNEPTN